MSKPTATPWRRWANKNSVGVNFTWRAISTGRLKVRRVGKRMLVLDEDGLAFLRALPEGPAAMPENLKRPRRSSPGEISPTQRLAVEAKAKNGEAA